MTAALSKPGDQITADHGHLRLTRTMTIEGGITIRVHAGPTEIGELARPFPRGTFRAAREWWDDIANLADTSTPIWQIVAAMRAIEDANVAAHLNEESR